MSDNTDFSKLCSSYLYKPMHTGFQSEICNGKWAAPINRLLTAGYSFYPGSYAPQGHLFRGMSQNLAQSVASKSFGHFSGSNEMSGVEEIMKIYFLSHEISDVISVSGVFHNKSDAGIIVIDVSVFIADLHQYQAAVLAIGDFGMVFRYPFLTRPVNLAEVSYIICSQACGETINSISPDITNKLICIDNPDRTAFSSEADKAFVNRHIQAAKPIRYKIYPQLDDCRGY